MLINIVLGLFAIYLVIGLVVLLGLLWFLATVAYKTSNNMKEEALDDFKY